MTKSVHVIGVFLHVTISTPNNTFSNYKSHLAKVPKEEIRSENMSRLLVLITAAIVLLVTTTYLVSGEVIGLDESTRFCNEKTKMFDLIQRICGPSYEVVNVDKSIRRGADTEYNQLVYEECCEKDCSTTFIKSVACPIEYLERATYRRKTATKTPWRIRCPTPLFSPYVVFSPVLDFLFSDCFYVADPEVDSIRNEFTEAVEA